MNVVRSFACVMGGAMFPPPRAVVSFARGEDCSRLKVDHARGRYRLKGLGEKSACYLEAPTMDPAQHTVLQRPDPAAIELPDKEFERARARQRAR
jgi:hypothetical protein